MISQIKFRVYIFVLHRGLSPFARRLSETGEYVGTIKLRLLRLATRIRLLLPFCLVNQSFPYSTTDPITSRRSIISSAAELLSAATQHINARKRQLVSERICRSAVVRKYLGLVPFCGYLILNVAGSTLVPPFDLARPRAIHHVEVNFTKL